MLGPGNQEVMLFLQSPPTRPGNPLQADSTANLFVITHTHILTPILMLLPPSLHQIVVTYPHFCLVSALLTI